MYRRARLRVPAYVMAQGLPLNSSTDPSPQPYVPSGVDAQSWLGFEQRVQERRFRALLENARSAIEIADRDGAQRALEEARELRPDAAEIVRLEQRLEKVPSPKAMVGLPLLVRSRTLHAVMFLSLGMAFFIGIDWWRASRETIEQPQRIESPALVTAEAPVTTSVTLSTPVTSATPATTPAPFSREPIDTAPEPTPEQRVPVASTGSLTTPRRPVEVRPAVPAVARPTFRSALVEPEPEGEIPDDYVARQSPRAVGSTGSAVTNRVA